MGTGARGAAHLSEALAAPDSAAVSLLRPSPNHGERAPGTNVEILVLHYTGMASEQAALDWLCNPASQVSSHYFVFEDGRVAQSVAEGRRAWHAGKSAWRGLDDINSRSIGIEIANPGHEFGYRAFPARQMEAVTALCRDIVARHAISPRDVVAHSDIAPMRKQDPGELFDWKGLAQAGVGLWVEPSRACAGTSLKPGDSGKRVAKLQADLARYGYPLDATGEYDRLTEMTVIAFQRHFRQSLVDGIADPATRATLVKLLRRSGSGNS
jgi:N-acetylmuramoyl-L-alanine amidase